MWSVARDMRVAQVVPPMVQRTPPATSSSLIRHMMIVLRRQARPAWFMGLMRMAMMLLVAPLVCAGPLWLMTPLAAMAMRTTAVLVVPHVMVLMAAAWRLAKSCVASVPM